MAQAALTLIRARFESELVQYWLGWSGNVALNAGDAATRTGPNFSANANLSYTVDLWGKIDDLADAARWEAAASAADLDNAALSLSIAVAEHYWQIALANERLEVGHLELRDALRAYELMRLRHDTGAVARLDQVQAEYNVTLKRTAIATQEDAKRRLRNGLAVLLSSEPPPSSPAAALPEPASTAPGSSDGAAPAAAPLRSPGALLAMEPQRLSAAAVPGLPALSIAETVAARPDLRATELRLRESLAATHIARANLYPSFTLSGSLSSGGNILAALFQNHIGTIAAAIAAPLTSWKSMQTQIAVSDINYESAQAGFRNALLTALQELADALSNRQRLAAEAEETELAALLARREADVTELRYRSGATGVQLWIDAQGRARTTALNVAQQRYGRLSNRARIYQVLGGGPTADPPLAPVSSHVPSAPVPAPVSARHSPWPRTQFLLPPPGSLNPLLVAFPHALFRPRAGLANDPARLARRGAAAAPARRRLAHQRGLSRRQAAGQPGTRRPPTPRRRRAPARRIRASSRRARLEARRHRHLLQHDQGRRDQPARRRQGGQ
ncbi:MAG: TolC family protein [Candidatus Protistobacter heckmanni]|nr:TolC family protein [Candidatus Protistobacter heckmanni]